MSSNLRHKRKDLKKILPCSLCKKPFYLFRKNSKCDACKKIISVETDRIKWIKRKTHKPLLGLCLYCNNSSLPGFTLCGDCKKRTEENWTINYRLKKSKAAKSLLTKVT